MFIFLNKITKITVFVCIFFLLILPLHVLSAEETGETEKPLLVINDEGVTLETFNNYWNLIPNEYKAELKKEDLLQQLITQTLLVQQANNLNLQSDPEISFQIKNTIDQILIQVLLEREIIEKTFLEDNEIQSYYDENKENYWKEEEIHALNIIVESEEEANEIIQQLKEGKDFSEIAKEKSIASSASIGGDIGFISKGTLKSDIEEKLFILNLDEISEIIQIDNNFHIFKVIEKIPAGYIELAEVKSEIESQLLPAKQQENFDQYLKNLEDQARIEKNLELLDLDSE